MRTKRFRLLAGVASTTLCLFAMTAYAQNTNTPATTGGATGSVSAPQGAPDAGAAQTPAPTTTGTTVTGTERTTATTGTTTTTTTFPGGVLGILAVAVIILLVLFALFRGRDKTVVRETSTSSSSAAPRTTGTATSDSASARAASGTGTSSSSSSMNDPNIRRLSIRGPQEKKRLDTMCRAVVFSESGNPDLNRGPPAPKAKTTKPTSGDSLTRGAWHFFYRRDVVLYVTLAVS